MEFWVNRCVTTDRLLVGAKGLPEGLPDWRCEPSVPAGRLTAQQELAILADIWESLRQHVRDGTARGERAWRQVQMVESRDWFRSLARELVRPLSPRSQAERWFLRALHAASAYSPDGPL